LLILSVISAALNPWRTVSPPADFVETLLFLSGTTTRNAPRCAARSVSSLAAPSSSGPIRIAHGIDYSVCLTSLTVCLLSVFLLDKGIPGRLAFPRVGPWPLDSGRLKMRSGPCPHRHTPPPELSFSLRQAIFASLPIVVVLILLPAIAFASPPDQLWIAGIYDGADGDESVSLVYETAGVEATPTRPVPLLPRSSEILVVSSPSSCH